MIRAWRAAWREPAMPFLFVQLPNFGDPAHVAPPETGQSAWAELREAQTAALELVNTAMAVTIDVGDGGDIHPRDKYDVARRLALLALARVYRKPVLATGPWFRSAARAGAALRVRFDGLAGAGLVTLDGQPPLGFVIAGADGVWHPAEAVIEGDTVRAWSRDVPEPVAVRYAWANDPPNTLRNQANLPAAPFRSDDWPGITGPR